MHHVMARVDALRPALPNTSLSAQIATPAVHCFCCMWHACCCVLLWLVTPSVWRTICRSWPSSEPVQRITHARTGAQGSLEYGVGRDVFQLALRSSRVYSSLALEENEKKAHSTTSSKVTNERAIHTIITTYVLRVSPCARPRRPMRRLN